MHWLSHYGNVFLRGRCGEAGPDGSRAHTIVAVAHPPAQNAGRWGNPIVERITAGLITPGLITLGFRRSHYFKSDRSSCSCCRLKPLGVSFFPVR